MVMKSIGMPMNIQRTKGLRTLSWETLTSNPSPKECFLFEMVIIGCKLEGHIYNVSMMMSLHGIPPWTPYYWTPPMV